MTPRPLTQRERTLIRLYTDWKFEMTPQRFYSKWEVTQETIASICWRSKSPVARWFGRGKISCRPMPADLRHLALMDFLLEHYEEIPEKLRNLLCPPE